MWDIKRAFHSSSNFLANAVSPQTVKIHQSQIQQVESDYSWALMQGVILAFNKESMPSPKAKNLGRYKIANIFTDMSCKKKHSEWFTNGKGIIQINCVLHPGKNKCCQIPQPFITCLPLKGWRHRFNDVRCHYYWWFSIFQTFQKDLWWWHGCLGKWRTTSEWWESLLLPRCNNVPSGQLPGDISTLEQG